MSEDIAVLSIQVDSTSAPEATQQVDRLTDAGRGAEKAMDGLRDASDRADASTKRLTETAAQGAATQDVVRTKVRLTREEIELAQQGNAKFEADQDKFYASLKRTAETFGMSRSQLAAYNAQLLDLGNSPAVKRYIEQIKQAEAAQAAAKDSGLGLGDALGKQMFRQVVRAGASFAVMTVGIQGTIEVVGMLLEASDHLSAALEQQALTAGRNGVAAAQLADKLQQEAEALRTMAAGSGEAATQQQKLRAIKEQIAAQGPEYYRVMANENLSIKEQVALIAELNAKKREQLQQQVYELTLKGPDISFKEKLEKTAGGLAALAGKIPNNDLAARIGQAFNEEATANEVKSVEDWKKKLQDIRTEMAKLDEPSGFRSELDKINDKLREQADALGKTQGQLVYEKELALGATEAEARRAKALQDAVDAQKKGTKASSDDNKATEKMIELLEREVASTHRITSEQVAYELSTRKLSKSDEERLAVLLRQNAETEREAELERAATQAYEDGNRAAKERDDLENKLLMDREKYLQTLRKTADPSFGAGDKLEREVGGLQELLGRGSISAEQYDKALSKVKEDYVRMEAQGSSSLQSLVDLTDTAAGHMGKAFGDFVTTGKLDFKGLVDSILADFARLEAEKAFQQLLGYVVGSFAPSIGGGGGGNLVSGSYGGGVDFSSGLGSAISGGAQAAGVAAPQLAGLAAGAGAGRAGLVAHTVINITNGPGGPQAQTSAQGGAGSEQVARQLEGAVIKVLVEQQRPGGVLNNA